MDDLRSEFVFADRKTHVAVDHRGGGRMAVVSANQFIDIAFVENATVLLERQ